MEASPPKLKRLRVCDEWSPARNHWEQWLDSKGLRHEVHDGMFCRLMDATEFSAYLVAITIQT